MNHPLRLLFFISLVLSSRDIAPPTAWPQTLNVEKALDSVTVSGSLPGTVERYVLYVQTVQGYLLQGGQRQHLGGGPVPGKPWKIRASDVDGDSAKEIIIALKKTAPYDPVVDNRLFVYNLHNGVLVPRWKGTHLAGRFIDFEFKDLDDDGKEELLTLEKSPKGNVVRYYRWSGFGFRGWPAPDSLRKLFAERRKP